MLRLSHLATALLIAASLTPYLPAQESGSDKQLSLMPGRSIVVESAVDVRRVAVANPAVVEVMPITSREFLVNALGSGDTSLILWTKEGGRIAYTVNVQSAASVLDKVREQLSRELNGQDVAIDFANGTVFLRGKVKDRTSAERAELIAGSLGKVVNLLYVDVPPAEAQILLKVRFADVDRTASTQLGANFFSTGLGNTVGAVAAGGTPAPTLQTTSSPITYTLSDALNVFLFRSDLNLGATIKALQSKNLLQILAEPNVLAIDNKPASFVAGGQFPFPTIQGGANAGAVTISFKEYGIRINFLPAVTPRGTIRLHVTPEVSSLDFANGLVFQGYTIPAISTRRVDTEVELESGQSFAIAGLLDNQTTETLSRIPGISSIPILGKLFQSVSRTRTNSELLIIVTPELVRPIPAGQALPEIEMPATFMKDAPTTAPQTPGAATNGPVPALPRLEAIPVERLRPRTPETSSGATSSGATSSGGPSSGVTGPALTVATTAAAAVASEGAAASAPPPAGGPQ